MTQPAIEWLLPRAPASPDALESLLARLRERQPIAPFAEESLRFCDEVGRALRLKAAGNPALASLAFWLRRAHLTEMHQDLPTRRGTVISGRGLVFHITPSNVDTMFAYSLVVSLLAGNANIIRLSERSGVDSALILATLAEVLATGDYPTVAANTTILRCGHDSDVMEAISQLCDTRVIWGGDRTIRSVRSIPLPAHATEVTFADKESLAAIGMTGYTDANDAERGEVARLLANDLLAFDQMGCASPRRLIWVTETAGSQAGSKDEVARNSTDLFTRLAAEAERRGFVVPTATAIGKMGAAAGAAAEGTCETITWHSNEVVTLSGPWPLNAPRAFPGGGTLWTSACRRVTDIAQVVSRSTQTVTTFGIPEGDLFALADASRHSGIDRIVPIGSALAFSHVWDGYNLLSHLTRTTSVR